MGPMTEHDDQAAVLRWARAAAVVDRRLDLLFAIPNAGRRSRGAGRWMCAEGLRRGVPDLCLPVRTAAHGALWIEMKTATGRVTADQGWWHEQLREQGYRVEVCRGAAAAIAVLEDYLGMRRGG